MNHRSTTVLLLAIACAGCRTSGHLPTLTPPVVTLELQNLTDAERRVVKSYIEDTAKDRWRVETISGPADASARHLTYEIHLARWSDHELLHRELVSLRGESHDHVILQNHESRASLAYTSSHSSSHSRATVAITVTPPAARLVIDSKIPRLHTMPATAGRRGHYELTLPFAFIKAHDCFYFHSVFKGQHRYYRYDLRTERQELLPGVDSPETFRRHRARN